MSELYIQKENLSNTQKYFPKFCKESHEHLIHLEFLCHFKITETNHAQNAWYVSGWGGLEQVMQWFASDSHVGGDGMSLILFVPSIFKMYRMRANALSILQTRLPQRMAILGHLD